MRKWLQRLLVTIVVLVLGVAAVGVVAVRRPFPQTEGTVTVTGLEAPVTIDRTEQGIPQITAATTHDLFFAQGYVHAQDRFWQMDFWRHIGSGRLSEMFGASQIETDRFLRTMGWRRVAEEEYRLSSPRTRAILDAYAEGVNAYLAERSPAQVSLEYAVLGLQNPDYRIEEWTPADTITWTKVMAWELRANLDEELDRASLAARFGVERAEQLYPAYPAAFPVIVEETNPTAMSESPASRLATGMLAALTDRIRLTDAVIGQRFEGIGSNNWVVSGTRTATGKPLLANDPHLALQMPSIWYQNHLRCQPVGAACPFNTVGFSFAGAPGVVIGHNDRVAWGFTSQAPDTMDVFVEQVNPDGTYQTPDGPADFETRTETIAVAGGDPVTVEIRSTIHGPVISEVYVDEAALGDSAAIDVPDVFSASLYWTALQPGLTVEAIIEYDLARNWDEFRAAAAKFHIAAQNLVYADVDGNIGYQSTGRIPIRDGWTGRYPVPGWEHLPPTDFVAVESMPSLFNPESGYIETANQPVNRVPADQTRMVIPYIGSDHASGYRAARIDSFLAGLDQATVADMTAIQLDVADGSAGYLVPILNRLQMDGPVATLLSDWEPPYPMEADSAAAAAYAGVWRHLIIDTFDELEPSGLPRGHSRLFAVFAKLVETPADPWWDVVGTPQKETRDDILTQAVTEAEAELTGLLGDDPSRWRWADIHTATFENQTLGKSDVAPIEALFNRSSPAELGGGSEIINAIGWSAANGYRVDWVPSMRMVVDLSDLSGSVAVHTTGQSGHAFHPNYFDLNPLWVAGETLPLPWDEIAGETLTLQPA